MPQQAFLGETEAAGEGPAAVIGGIGVQGDAVEAERAERLVEDRGYGL